MTHISSIKPTPFGAWDQDALAAAWQEQRRQEIGVGRRPEPTEAGRRLLNLFDRHEYLTITDIAHKTGLNHARIETSLKALKRAGWVEFSVSRGQDAGEPDIKIWRAIK